jgi:hypothetical protein
MRDLRLPVRSEGQSGLAPGRGSMPHNVARSSPPSKPASMPTLDERQGAKPAHAQEDARFEALKGLLATTQRAFAEREPMAADTPAKAPGSKGPARASAAHPVLGWRSHCNPLK